MNYETFMLQPIPKLWAKIAKTDSFQQMEYWTKDVTSSGIKYMLKILLIENDNLYTY